jgi:hypothetical protein
MKKHFTFVLAIALTAVVTAFATEYLLTRNTTAAFIATANNMEAFNELRRIESWDRAEQFLVKGCNKEALEYIRAQQAMATSSLQWLLKNGASLEEEVAKENRHIVDRVQTFTSSGTYNIPLCK